MYKGWIAKYPFVSIEDPFDQDDWDAYRKLMDTLELTIAGQDKAARSDETCV